MERELLNAAAELFARNGFGGTSLGEIAESAGVGRTTLYHYFKSKEDFLAALVENVTAAILSDLRAIKDVPGLSSREKVERAAKVLVGRTLENPLRFRVLDKNEASLPPALFKRHMQMKRAALDEIVTIIQEGIGRGEFRAVHPRISGLTLFGMSNWASWWFSPDGEKTAPEVAAYIADLAVHALTQQNEASRGDPVSLIGGIRAELDVLEDIVAGKIAGAVSASRDGRQKPKVPRIKRRITRDRSE